MEQPRSTEQHAPSSADVIVIGGGIIGCAAAAIMADRGASVILVEGSAIGAGASGRNLGAIQHPFDRDLADLHVDSLARYRALADAAGGPFRLADAPAGLLLLQPDGETATSRARALADAFPELDPRALTADEVVALEPSLAAGPAGVLLATGYPIPPASATAAWAVLATERGARLLLGSEAQPAISGDRATGVVLDDGTAIASDAVLVAAGPWTSRLVDPSGTWQPITPTYGVTLQLRLGSATPRHVVEEDEVDAINRAEAATARALDTDETGEPPSLFSMASADGLSTLGSTFLPAEPDPARVEALLLRRAASFLPAVTEAEVVGRRMCARPQSVDGRPFIGAVGPDGLFVCAGHGPWGISTGPGSAAVVARAMLDGTSPPAPFDASRAVP